jgi:hypothetical protein
MNKAQLPTSGHKTCRFQWVFERFVPPREFVSVDTDAAPQSGTFHTANVVPNSSSRFKQLIFNANCWRLDDEI